MILKIFQGFSLFSYQCSLFCSLATACLFYQIAVRLSSTFFIFLNSVLSSLSCDSLFILSKCFAFVKNFFHFLLHLCFKAKESAGGGIRTHAPLRTNGFQDRLVMTTSIPLHNVFCCCRFVCLTRRLVYNTKPEYICQHFFQSFFIFFVFSL